MSRSGQTAPALGEDTGSEGRAHGEVRKGTVAL